MNLDEWELLLDNIKTTDGPCIELDARVCAGFRYAGDCYSSWMTKFADDNFVPGDHRLVGRVLIIGENGEHIAHYGAQAVTKSLDEARALFRSIFPGWWMNTGECHLSDDVRIAPDFSDPEHGERLAREFPLPEVKYRDEHGDFTYGPFNDGFDIDRRPAGNLPIAIIQAMIEAKLYILKQAAH
ncbi:hypothetical protein [Methylosinus sporium]|uniref:Uncharacterized protein n=1 Tax=Methylosinus sporium TaxID=428 RepID=A0A2U1SSY4_METSR|nr:hypothetical protein [Methylosinus sporium]PWB94712.1 hypothetical protein C5689_06510 [Methylosinus sporium]